MSKNQWAVCGAQWAGGFGEGEFDGAFRVFALPAAALVFAQEMHGEIHYHTQADANYVIMRLWEHIAELS